MIPNDYAQAGLRKNAQPLVLYRSLMKNGDRFIFRGFVANK